MDGILHGKVCNPGRAFITAALTIWPFRKIGIYHGRPTSIVRSDIDADLPGNTAASDLVSFDFDATGLLDSIQLTCQAEAYLHQM